MAGQGNDSNKAKNYLLNLSPNIFVIRHPNKLFGRTKAVLWSHHEKLVIIDRFVFCPHFKFILELLVLLGDWTFQLIDMMILIISSKMKKELSLSYPIFFS